ncbi:unnamed protein product [Mytilus edulis]|uniref:HAT C-terminal dimerisation domain-containing protein n=1 Tax=Mytilus edulis TaxID=6550 RepID=A0A8S3VRI0_MYTED|nr:unnamed protein product [Mytilus edulis]
MAELKNGWSFLKRSGGEEKKPSKYAKYEQNRGKRRFQESWKTGRPWLKVSAESMSCTWCTDVHEAPNEFCWTTAKVETLKSHESSKAHIKSVGVIKGRTLVAKGEITEAQKSIESLNKAVINKLSILFKTVHALCLAGRPFSDYVWMSKLDKAKGLDIGQTYLNSNSAKEFSKFIALTELNKIAQIIQSSKFVSILSDGSTDCSVTEVEIVYARICNAGEIKVFFLNPAFVDKSDADGIIAAMIRSVEKVGVPWEEFLKKLVGMGSDGASVMLGKNNGVAAKLRSLQPSMVAVHCYAHKLELAFKDAIKHVPLDTKVTTCLLQGLYYFYHNSALNRANLKSSFRTLNKKVLLPTRIGGTRWVGHLLRALENFLTGYEAVKQHLEQICSPDAVERSSASTSGKAKGLLKLVKSKHVMLYCYFLADIATILFRLSKVFQRRECCASDIYGMVEETNNLIDLYSTKDGPFLLKGKQSLGLTPDEDIGPVQQRRGESFSSARQKLIDELKKSLQSRFECVAVIQAMSICNFRSWPVQSDDNKTEIADFGDGKLSQLIDHFGPCLESINTAEAVFEWSAMKTALYSSDLVIKSLTWQRVNEMHLENYGNILAIMDLILTIPGSSSECERGFRQMKSVKTTFRSSLNEESLASQMTIRLHSPPIEK